MIKAPAIIQAPGLFRLPPQAYHADPCPRPSLSAGVAKILIDKTPMHARRVHPRLNKAFDPVQSQENTRSTAFGACCHELMLGIHDGEESLIDVIRADNYTEGADGIAKANREARDASIAEGRVPVLKPDYERALECVEAARAQIDIVADWPGESEITAIAEIGDVWCRCLSDRLADDHRTIIDPKFGAFSGNASAWNKHAINMGYDIVQGHYRTVLAEIEGVDVSKIDYLFLAVEDKPPYAAQLIRLPVEHRDSGLEKAAYARGLFGECLKHNRWPGHGTHVHEGEAVGWDVQRWEIRKLDQQIATYVDAHAPDGIETIGEWR